MTHAHNESGNITVGDKEIPFRVSRSRRRRRSIALAIEPPHTLHIMAPARTSMFSIHMAVRQHSRWIIKRLAHAEAAPPPRQFMEGEGFLYMGHNYRLQVSFDYDKPQGCTLLPHRLLVNLHSEAANTEQQREDVRLEVALWLKKRAKLKLQKRLDFWSARMKLPYRKFVMSNPERLWGSCTGQNVIRLNWRLIMAPLRLIDYVAVHELAHVAHKDHSPRFWRCVASALPDCKQLRLELRAMRHHLEF